MQKPVYILGISQSHTASAALLKDGEIIAAASEERFTREKLQPGIPKAAISYCLSFAKIKKEDIAKVAVADTSAPVFGKKVHEVKPQTNNIAQEALFTLEEQIEKHIPHSRELIFATYKQLNKIKSKKTQETRLKNLSKILQVEPEKFSFVNHHLCHAQAALFSSSFPRNNNPSLIFTSDGVGDFESGTIYLYKSGKVKKIVSIDSQQSLGFFFLHITQLLGLKPLEDEYKIMGLAPYSDDQKSHEVYQILKPYFDLNKQQNRWNIKISEFNLYRKLPQLLRYKRFDHIAHAAQRILEEILSLWVSNAVITYKVANIVLGGGVFANVKVNQRISQLKNVKSVFCMPSPSDESNAIGAAFSLYFRETGKTPSPLDTLYLGPSFSKNEAEREVKSLTSKMYKVQNPKDINQEIAKLLADEQVVARFSGRMEFGARALGNRSILAHPAKREVVDFINFAIKSRDFWMPFAPTILRKRATDYLVTHHADSLFMNVAYNTTPKGKQHLAAAIHPSDLTTRPQILNYDDNPDYFDLISRFEKITGIGAVLNTSFNLHGEPIVCSPADAIKTFKNSRLKHLALEKFLISKR